MDDFKVKTVYEERTYERHRFSFSIGGREYEGNFHEGEIQWLHPHPKQDLNEDQLQWIESEVRRLLSENEVIDNAEELDGLEVEPMFPDQVHQAHQFKLNIEGEQFKGMVRNGKLEWFHPKPRRKLANDKVEKVEKQIQEKVKKQIDEEE
ncbi:HicA family toxin-antitoxin system [Bacillus sp. SD088]|uniref:HicA family toxin-antitoxin system n=1 Tax=Bacillus sp. SD088 TaxID=2782012 RepID=UPI001A968886|nr:HicA family toxin-antitoxin system [Bacillus sp. SD088]MBO0993754.1 HicA family toxin-antitoxin system [Bacillus sp. SD088]